MATVPEFEFVLVVDGPIEDDAMIDLLYEAGCGDATLGSVDGVGFAEFMREADRFAEAVTSAIADVEKVAGFRVRRVEPDDLVTLSEIGERLGRTRESVRLLAAGERGAGDFPAPASHLRSRFRLWRWSEIAAWANVVSKEDRANALFVAALNAALEMRALRQLPAAERTMVRRLATG
jgi:hypothetical protein